MRDSVLNTRGAMVVLPPLTVLMLNKKRRSLRTVAAKVRVVCKSTVGNIMKKQGAKAYHKRKVQKMTPLHMEKRVKFARWALQQYGTGLGPRCVWRRLLNSDFSAFVKIEQGNLNTKNDIIWSHSIQEVGDLLDHQQEKFAVSLMIFGAVSVRGLLPPDAPVFVDQLLTQWEPRPKTVSGQIYADLIRTVVAPAARELYPRGDGIWQDDGAKIHRTAEVLQAVQQNFKHRVPVDLQAPKMADVWVIENVWAILKEKVKAAEPQNKEALRKVITKAWREINADKPLLLRLMSSIPKRLQAVIDRDGAQIRRKDYQ